jgi:hypothetical protein
VLQRIGCTALESSATRRRRRACDAPAAGLTLSGKVVRDQDVLWRHNAAPGPAVARVDIAILAIRQREMLTCQ